MAHEREDIVSYLMYANDDQGKPTAIIVKDAANAMADFFPADSDGLATILSNLCQAKDNANQLILNGGV